jgi:hypothetical protein
MSPLRLPLVFKIYSLRVKDISAELVKSLGFIAPFLFQASPSGKVQRIRSLHEDPTVTSESSSATATLRPPTTVLDDVFISVKTTKSYHNHRLPIILKTWFQLAKAQVTTHVGRVSAPWERGSVEGVFGSRNGGIIDGTKTPTGGPPAAEFPPELALSSKLTTS